MTPRFSLRQLAIFMAIADTGSTASAGAVLHLSQSAVSAGLIELERALDASLFNRVGKRLNLNDNGLTLLPLARRLIADSLDIEATLRDDGPAQWQRLTLGMSTTIGTYMLPEMLADHIRAHPHPFARTRVANTTEVIEAVARSELDLGLIEGPADDERVAATAWLRDDLLIIAAPHYFNLEPEQITARELSNARWLFREPGSGTRDRVEHHLNGLGIVPVDTLEMETSEAIRRAAALGLGVSCLSRWIVADALSNGSLIAIEQPAYAMTRQCYLITLRGGRDTATVRRFRQFLLDWATARQPITELTGSTQRGVN